MDNILNDSVEITSAEYMNLKNPIFKGQSKLDSNDMYWMCFEDSGVLYKIHNKL